MYDVLSQIRFARALSPAAAITDNTAQVCQVLDMAGFNGAGVVVQMGAAADADMTITALLEHSDASGSGYTAVSDDDLIGTEAGMALQFDSDNKTAKLGYKGTKRYLRLTLTPANNTGNLFISATYLLFNPRTLPQSTQQV